ncbi:MAG: DUF234 domain-containing protein, partial [Promethearchaeota archaeon]
EINVTLALARIIDTFSGTNILIIYTVGRLFMLYLVLKIKCSIPFLRLFPMYRQICRWLFKEEEIDIIALNEEDNEIFFIECKWSNIDAKKAENIVGDLKRNGSIFTERKNLILA